MSNQGLPVCDGTPRETPFELIFSIVGMFAKCARLKCHFFIQPVNLKLVLWALVTGRFLLPLTFMPLLLRRLDIPFTRWGVADTSEDKISRMPGGGGGGEGGGY